MAAGKPKTGLQHGTGPRGRTAATVVTGFVGDAITPGPVFYSDDSVPMGVLSLSSASFGFPIESVVLASEEITNELILPGFTLGAGWTTILSYFSSFGFSHVAGNTAPVVGSTSFVSGDTYDIEWVVTRTSGSITIAVGGWSQSGITASGTANETLTTPETLTITPTSDFVGTIFVSITYWSGTLVNTVFDFSLAGNSGYLALLVGVNS